MGKDNFPRSLPTNPVKLRLYVLRTYVLKACIDHLI
jgi:hypothetical protein